MQTWRVFTEPVTYILEILTYFCCKPAGRIQKPITIQEIAEPGDIPDMVVNIPISDYKEHFTDEAWKLICNIGMHVTNYVYIHIVIATAIASW